MLLSYLLGPKVRHLASALLAMRCTRLPPDLRDEIDGELRFLIKEPHEYFGVHRMLVDGLGVRRLDAVRSANNGVRHTHQVVEPLA